MKTAILKMDCFQNRIWARKKRRICRSNGTTSWVLEMTSLKGVFSSPKFDNLAATEPRQPPMQYWRPRRGERSLMVRNKLFTLNIICVDSCCAPLDALVCFIWFASPAQNRPPKLITALLTLWRLNENSPFAPTLGLRFVVKCVSWTVKKLSDWRTLGFSFGFGDVSR